MNCFQLIKTVLDEVYEQIPAPDEATKDELILAQMLSLRAQYTQLKNGLRIDYHDPVTRFAYLYKYVTSHTNIVYRIIELSPLLRALFDQSSVSMTCLGGGPGSDFLGVLKYLLLNQKQPELRCFLYDREQAWGESWVDVDAKLQVPFRIATNFQSFDVTIPDTWNQHTKYLNVDIFTMVFFLSEVYALRTQAMPFLENLFTDAKQGAIFLYVDNSSAIFTGWFDALVHHYGFRSVECVTMDLSMPLDEQKRDLGVYIDKFPESPKLTSSVAWHICQKI